MTDNALMTTDVSEALALATSTINQLTTVIARMKEPAEFGMAVMDDGQCYGFSEAAKVLNDRIERETGRRIGRNTLFDALVEMGILIGSGPHHHEPYQQYEHHFKLVPKSTPVGMKVTPLFTGKGLSWILPKLVEYYR